MKTHLTTEEIYDLAYAKIDVSNIKVDKEQELAKLLDLEYDEAVGEYKNPDFFTPEEFLIDKYNHNKDHTKGKFGFYEVISIIEEYVRDYK